MINTPDEWLNFPELVVLPPKNAYVPLTRRGKNNFLPTWDKTEWINSDLWIREVPSGDYPAHARNLFQRAGQKRRVMN